MQVEIQGWKANLKFSSSHLIPNHPRCGNLHGHTYFLNIRLQGKPGPEGFVVDFGELKPMLRDLCHELDHRMLVPSAHPDVQVTQGDPLDVQVGEKQYQFPRCDVVLLEIENATVEHLAEYLIDRFLLKLGKPDNVESVDLGLEEGWGQGVWVSRKL